MGYATKSTLFYGNDTLPSGADLSSSAGLWGDVDGSGNVVLGTSGTGAGIIVDGGTASGDQVALGYGEVWAIAGAAVTAGTTIESDAAGKTITGVGASLGYAITAAAADGDDIKIFVVPGASFP